MADVLPNRRFTDVSYGRVSSCSFAGGDEQIVSRTFAFNFRMLLRTNANGRFWEAALRDTGFRTRSAPGRKRQALLELEAPSLPGSATLHHRGFDPVAVRGGGHDVRHQPGCHISVDPYSTSRRACPCVCAGRPRAMRLARWGSVTGWSAPAAPAIVRQSVRE